MILYKTVFKTAETEQIINRSRFITHVAPVNSYEEAQTFVAKIKEKYKDATHNVPAIVFGEKQNMQWASDDGEPAGTSGAPMLRVIVEEELTNVAVVVTRYFGGIKLGTGGLVRAYSGSCRQGLEAAGTAEVKDKKILRYSMDYSFLGKLNSISKDGGFDVIKTEYTDLVTVDLSVDPERSNHLKNIINDLTSGKGALLEERVDILKERI